MKQSIFAAFAVCSLLAGLCSGSAHAAGGLVQTWTKPLEISFTQVKSWFPDLVADKTGRVHVVWSSHADGYDTANYRSLLPNQSWTSPTDVFAESVIERRLQEVTRPVLALDNAGNLLMLNRVLSIYFSKAHSSLAGNAASWTPPAAINTEEASYFSHITVDSKDTIHAFITQNVPTPSCQLCYHLFYLSSKDGGMRWSPVQDISIASSGVVKPHVIVDRQDNLHVVWEAGASGGSLGQALPPTSVFYTSSRDGGDTWSEPLDFVKGFDLPNDSQLRNPAIALDGQGQLILAALRLPADVIYYHISKDAGQTWSAPNVLQGFWGTWSILDSRLDGYSMATDSAGHVHLVAAGRISSDQKTIGVYHHTWDGANWSQPYTVQSPGNYTLIWPRITVALGNQLHIVWSMNLDERLQGETGDVPGLQIYYSTAVADAPALAPVAYPTPTPAPTPTPESQAQVFQPTAPALGNKALGQVDYQNLRTEVDDYGMLLLSGLPVALLFVLGYFILRRRRA